MRRLLLAIMLLGISGAALAAGRPYAGVYKSKEAVIEIGRVGSGEFAGIITARGQVFHFTARETAGALTGSYTADGEKVDFRATLRGDTLTFATEDGSYMLARQEGLVPAVGNTAASNAAWKAPAPSARSGRERSLRINRVAIAEDQVRKFEQENRMRLPRGDFWYDKVSGAWGRDGGPTAGFTAPGMNLGGPLRPDASRGDTGVFINGRQLPVQDVRGLQQISVPVTRGHWWVDSRGDFGVEGSPVLLGNIFQFSRGRGGSYQRATAGGYIGGDGQSSYFFDPKTGSSVMAGN